MSSSSLNILPDPKYTQLIWPSCCFQTLDLSCSPERLSSTYSATSCLISQNFWWGLDLKHFYIKSRHHFRNLSLQFNFIQTEVCEKKSFTTTFYENEEVSVFRDWSNWSSRYSAFLSKCVQATWIFGDPFTFKIVKEASSAHTAWSVVKNEVFSLLVKGTIW